MSVLYIKVLVNYAFKNTRPKKANRIRWDYSLALHNPVTMLSYSDVKCFEVARVRVNYLVL